MAMDPMWGQIGSAISIKDRTYRGIVDYPKYFEGTKELVELSLGDMDHANASGDDHGEAEASTIRLFFECTTFCKELYSSRDLCAWFDYCFICSRCVTWTFDCPAKKLG